MRSIKNAYVSLIDAVFMVVLVAVAVFFMTLMAALDTQHKADSEFRLSGYYYVE